MLKESYLALHQSVKLNNYYLIYRKLLLLYMVFLNLDLKLRQSVKYVQSCIEQLAGLKFRSNIKVKHRK